MMNYKQNVMHSREYLINWKPSMRNKRKQLKTKLLDILEMLVQSKDQHRGASKIPMDNFLINQPRK